MACPAKTGAVNLSACFSNHDIQSVVSFSNPRVTYEWFSSGSGSFWASALMFLLPDI